MSLSIAEKKINQPQSQGKKTQNNSLTNKYEDKDKAISIDRNTKCY
jgi:hypothetical protein